jgi:putative phosphoesterase
MVNHIWCSLSVCPLRVCGPNHSTPPNYPRFSGRRSTEFNTRRLVPYVWIVVKILVLADIHSNWQALSAIDEQFDACVIAGDVVDYGVQPAECIEWARQNDAIVIRGNHDHAVAQRVPVKAGSGFRRLAAFARPLHWEVLSADHLSWLARLPVTSYVTIGGLKFFLVHGTPRDPLDEYLNADPVAWAARLEGIDADFVCVGHSHLPLHFDLGGKNVLNPGSVGQPRDGDPRCSYAIIEDGEVEFKRVEYDIDETLARYKATNIKRDAMNIVQSVLTTGGRMPS